MTGSCTSPETTARPGELHRVDPQPRANRFDQQHRTVARPDGATAYVSVDRHRANDSSPYIFKTENYGQTWKAVGRRSRRASSVTSGSSGGYIRKKGLLYAGTENGVFASIDDGATWTPLQNNLPPMHQ